MFTTQPSDLPGGSILSTVAAAVLGVCMGLTSATAQSTQPTASGFGVLVFSKTAGFRHDSIGAGVAAVTALGQRERFRVDATEAAGAFTDDNLRRYRVVMFLNTTGDVLDADQQAAFERFIRRGGGFVGVHSASDTEYDWPWYGHLVGAYFKSHPRIQPATLRVVDASHPSTVHLPIEWKRTDEWYNFREDPAAHGRALLLIDEKSYTGGTMRAHHPMAWCQEYDGGRSWYTALGHTAETFAEPLFLEHLLGGIRWAAGSAE
jgi:type 1 glutamine amidotransferase